MKINIEPTKDCEPTDDFLGQNWAVSMDAQRELTADEAMALCAKALVAYGYHEESIRECLDPNLAGELFGFNDVYPRGE